MVQKQISAVIIKQSPLPSPKKGPEGYAPLPLYTFTAALVQIIAEQQIFKQIFLSLVQ